MRSELVCATIVGDSRVELEYGDGLLATLDFAAYFAERRGPIIEPLKNPSGFATARIDHDALTWATGYDICPDVLRFWCERGRICSREETESFFAALGPLHDS